MPALLRSVRFVAVTVVLLSLSACSGVLKSLPGDEQGSEEQGEEEVDLSQYEEFDPSPYREEELAENKEVEHDVPARLLSGKAAEGVERTVQGFRVQILSSKDKSAAEDAAAEAAQWWRKQASEAPDNLFASEDLPVYTVYRQPFYRVRVGNFTSREQAERALKFLSQRYSDAFIARGEVTVTQ